MKASVLQLLLLATLGACTRRVQPASEAAPETPGSTTVPPGCSPMHGGMPESPRDRPVWQNGARLEASDSGSAPIVMLVVRALDGLPLEGAMVDLDTPGTFRTVVTDVSGHVTARVRTGRVPILARRMGYKRYVDTITVRGGFADTVRLGLGTDKICFM